MSGRKLPSIKARDVIRVLRRLNFSPVRQRGSHIFFEHRDGRTTLVSEHAGEDIGKGLLRHILKEADISPAEFLENL